MKSCIALLSFYDGLTCVCLYGYPRRFRLSFDYAIHEHFSLLFFAFTVAHYHCQMALNPQLGNLSDISLNHNTSSPFNTAMKRDDYFIYAVRYYLIGCLSLYASSSVQDPRWMPSESLSSLSSSSPSLLKTVKSQITFPTSRRGNSSSLRTSVRPNEINQYFFFFSSSSFYDYIYGLDSSHLS